MEKKISRKKLMGVISCGAAGFSMLFAAGALAETAQSPVESGVYISPSVGFGDTDVHTGSFSGRGHSFVLSPQIGYQFNRNIALELGYTNFSSFDGSVSSSGNSKVEVDSHYFHIAFDGIYNLPAHFQLFAKAGAARVATKYSNNITEGDAQTVALAAGTYHETTPFLAGGFAYSFERTMRVNLQVAATTSRNNVPSLWATTVGFTHIFSV